MPKPVGSVVNLYYDTPYPVAEGEYLLKTTARAYEVLEVRIQKGLYEPNRKRIKALVINAVDIKPGVNIHKFFWYSRSKQR